MPLEDIYYTYCFVLNRPEQEFFESSLAKVVWVIEETENRREGKKREQAHYCGSMDEFLS